MNLMLGRVQDTSRKVSFAINLSLILATTAKVWSLALPPPRKNRPGQLKLPLRSFGSQRHQTPIIRS